MVDDEVLLGVTFLKKFWHCPKVNIKDACSKYKSLEALMKAYNKSYDVNLIRKTMKSIKHGTKKLDMKVNKKEPNNKFQDRIVSMSDKKLINAFNQRRRKGNEID